MRVLQSEDVPELERYSAEIRSFLLELGHDANIKLHYGAMFSCIEILVYLYRCRMNVESSDPSDAGRDRFVLSKGHAAPALYALLACEGFFPLEFFNDFRVIGSRLQGHPDRNKTPGIDCTTGSLGQGMPVACGMALGALLGFGISGRQIFNVYSLISDGECNEGSIWEAAMIASNKHLGNLTVILDRNGKSAYGPMRGRNDIEPIAEKWKAFGWHVTECDGHDFSALEYAFSETDAETEKPSLIICNTVKNKGIPAAEKKNMKSNFLLQKDYYDEAVTLQRRIAAGGTESD